jgi:hypothetical protein
MVRVVQGSRRFGRGSQVRTLDFIRAAQIIAGRFLSYERFVA